MVKENCNFLWFSCSIAFKYYLVANPDTQYFQTICLFWKWMLRSLRKKSQKKILPLTSIGQKLVMSLFQSEIFDVPAGCTGVWYRMFFLISFELHCSFLLYLDDGFFLCWSGESTSSLGPMWFWTMWVWRSAWGSRFTRMEGSLQQMPQKEELVTPQQMVNWLLVVIAQEMIRGTQVWSWMNSCSSTPLCLRSRFVIWVCMLDIWYFRLFNQTDSRMVTIEIKPDTSSF